jgi:hypothetical protein
MIQPPPGEGQETTNQILSGPAGRKNHHRLLLFSVFLIAFLCYWIPPVLAGKSQTPCFAYFNQLAESFLDRHLSLAHPACLTDLTQHDGKWYVPFLPLPAFLMAPWIAVFGSINTVLFAAVMGAANAGLVFVLLEALAARRWTALGSQTNFWLAILFALGTVHWTASTQGSVWFVAQICTVTFVALSAVLAASRNSPLLAGGALALAMLARPNIVLTYPLLLGFAIQHMLDNGTPDRKRYLARWAALSLAPILLAIGGIFLYNGLRFGNPLDFGYTSANVDAPLVESLRTLGQFNIAYIGRNLNVMLLSLPVWDATRHRLTPIEEGMAIWLTTPAFLYIFRGLRRTPIAIGAWISVGLLLVPLLTYFNTGWAQFGYRFTLDFIVPLFVLLAIGLGSRMSNVFKILVAASILVNLWGTAWYLGLY